MSTPTRFLRVLPDPPMVNFGHCLWKFGAGSDGDGCISVENEAVAELIRERLTDEVLDAMVVEIETWKDLDNDPDTWRLLCRDVIVKAITESVAL